MRHRMLSFCLTASIFAFSGPAAAAFIDFVPVGGPGNLPDTLTSCTQAECGSVATPYVIGKYEVTNQQYAQFLNAVADADPNALYNTSMSIDARGGITQSGSSGSYSYAVKPGRANNPVVFVSFYDALRFANWLHNGQPTAPQGPGTTEDGAYTITPSGVAANTIERNGGARYFLPTENEWYKAAYYDDKGAGTYYDYATATNTTPSSGPPPGGSNSANYWSGTFALTGSGSFDNGFNYLSNVGAYGSAVSPNGTFDQAGNVWEWNETIAAAPTTYRVKRGGDWNDQDSYLYAGLGVTGNPGAPGEDFETGFRIAPEPGADLLAATAALMLAARRGWRRSARNLAV